MTTLYYRDHGRRSKEEKAQGQQYLSPSEEKALERYLKQMADLGESCANQVSTIPRLQYRPPAFHNEQSDQASE